MPIYDFICKECDHEFTVRTSYSKKQETNCPLCESDNLQEDYRGYGGGLNFKSTKSNRSSFT